MTFSRNAPIRVKNILTRALPDEQGDSSNTPCFYMCSQYQRKLKVDILMVSKAFDYRLLIRTCKKLNSKLCFVYFILFKTRPKTNLPVIAHLLVRA